MAKFQHGTSYKEMPSGLKIFAETQTPTVIVGTGTINMGDMSCVNKPILIQNSKDAATYFGGANNIKGFTMSFRINTNVNALNTHANAVSNNVDLSKSLNKLSSGLRIQTAADDASGLSIADSLRSQASALGQAIANGNDAIGIIQVADKAMDEQLKILDTIKTKATQSAQDGQTTQSRQALQADVVRLMEELDNIGNTTSFNGQQLLNGTFSNKEFQIGAYSNQTVKASIGVLGISWRISAIFK